MMELYNRNALDCSKITANNYSTSFSFGIRLFKRKYRPAIYAIYGFVRFADEIVDTFHEYNKQELLQSFKEDTWKAIETGISTNPILQSFQKVVNEFKIKHEYIEAFLHSMEMDLSYQNYNAAEIKKYIYGSAEVVGLMCLKIFYKNNNQEFDKLIYSARKLGEAFQKVNFLRDIKADYVEKNRLYFPEIDIDKFTTDQKQQIEKDIEFDFKEAKAGIKKLHKDVRLGVYVAYCYYLKLLNKIEKTTPDQILNQRYRISDSAKIMIIIKAWIWHKLGMI